MLGQFAPSLDTLKLDNTGLAGEACKAIRDYLASTKCKVAVLSLGENDIDDTNFCEICIGISQNFSLRALNF